MQMQSLRNWFARTEEPPAPVLAITPEEGQAETAAPTLLPARKPIWTPERLRVVTLLWGEGFQFPGGEAETLRVAKPLGLSAASTLLLLGAGGGGPACAVASKLGAWVNGFEADPDLATAAAAMISRTKLGRRARVDAWDPGDPEFDQNHYHHALAFEPLRGHQPEPLLAAVAAALKPGGQLTLIELVADTTLSRAEPDVDDWAKVEHRDPEALPTEVAITRVLGRLGFDVRITEDISGRHVQQAMMGWRRLVRGMEVERRPNRETALLVEEAELWLLRLKLFRARRLRLIRWHAIGRGMA